MSSEKITVEISEAEAGQRLDRVLASRLQLPRNQIQQWIQADRVCLAGREVKAAHPVSAGEIFTCDPPVRDLRRGIEPESGALHVLFEDPEFVVLDKQAGLVVHPGAGRTHGTLVHRLLSRFPEISEVGGPGRPGIVHRLDKDTSGLLVVARTSRAYEALSRAFAERRIEKRYLGIVYGAPDERSGLIEAPIGRHPVHRKVMAIRANGRPAVTGFHTLATVAGVTLLELDLQTGRTHQIRVHLKKLGHPLIGDPVYGEARWKGLPRQQQDALRRFPRPALHAWRLDFCHPSTQEWMSFQAPVPEDMSLLWQQVTSSPFPSLR